MDQVDMEQKILRNLRESVMEEMDFSSEISDEKLFARIDYALMRESRKRLLSIEERTRLRRRVFDSFRRLDILQELLEDESVTEIMVNGMESIYLERGGRLSRWDRTFDSEEKLMDVVQQMAARVNRVVNTSSPIVDARLSDGSRIHVVLPPAAPDGPILTIRKFPSEPITMEQMIRIGSITREASVFLQRLVLAGYNLFISGGTGSGKTTFLNALSAYIPQDERVITIEDSLELRLSLAHCVRLEARNANLEGEREIRIRDLIRAALRMRPDRLILGEVRGEEALDMLQAMNTGHDGSLSTGHGNSPKDMLARLETMILTGGELPLPAVRGQMASALDVMVHLVRSRDGHRRVDSIVEVLGYEEGEVQLNSLFESRPGPDKEQVLIAVGTLYQQGKWRNAGLPEIPAVGGGDVSLCGGSGGDLADDGNSVL